MTVLRRAVAVLAVGAVGATAAAAPAGAATLQTDACVRYVAGQPTMTIVGTGFTPSGSATLASTTKAKPSPVAFASSPVLPNGGFVTRTLPPAFSSPNRTLQSFTLVGLDTANPAAFGTTPFQVVRFGLTTKPTPRRPTSRVTYTARGFDAGKRVYVHFRFRGMTRRTVSLGVAKGPCGIATRRMRALPTKALYGPWTTYTNQSRRSVRALPYWKDSFTIFRRFG